MGRKGAQRGAEGSSMLGGGELRLWRGSVCRQGSVCQQESAGSSTVQKLKAFGTCSVRTAGDRQQPA